MEGRDYSVTEPTHIAGLKWVSAEPFRDERGLNMLLWNEAEFVRATGLFELTFVEDSVSTSHAGVLRGVHIEPKAWRLVTCLAGHAFLAVVDYRNWSPTYLEHAVFGLRPAPLRQLMVPPMFGLGALALEGGTILHYKWTVPCDPARQLTYRYDDPRFGIAWPLDGLGAPILSARDQGAR